MYTSRRAKNFDDNDSVGEEDEDTQQDPAMITYTDTHGHCSVMKGNPKFMPYNSMFKNLT